MLELWNSWYDTLASVEALATVIVIVLVATGAITLAENRRQKPRPTKD
jgi:amino acid transporter